jgi:hypothetical protein
MTNLAPVAIYTYTRLDHLRKTLDSLALNYLAKDTTVYIVSDGPKNSADKVMVENLRNFVDDYKGFYEIIKIYRHKNLGVGLSPLMAEREIIGDHGVIISMEDDNVSSTNYLDFINQGLHHFENDDLTYCICGYTPPINIVDGDKCDMWRYPWQLSWGYGTWKTKYEKIHPLVNQYKTQAALGVLASQNSKGGLYITDSLRRDYLGQKKFLDAVLATNIFELGMSCVVPTISKIINIGQDGSGQSSTKSTDKYFTALDLSGKRIFDMHTQSPHAKYYQAIAAKFYNGSVVTRIARKFGFYEFLVQLKDKVNLKK